MKRTLKHINTILYNLFYVSYVLVLDFIFDVAQTNDTGLTDMATIKTRTHLETQTTRKML